jgi:hypothetical protein
MFSGHNSMWTERDLHPNDAVLASALQDFVNSKVRGLGHLHTNSATIALILLPINYRVTHKYLRTVHIEQ